MVFLAAIPLLSTWTGYQDRRVANRLRGAGVEVDAQIIEHRRADGSNQVRVSFETVDGRHFDTWVVVGAFRVPGPAQIRYLPTDPTVSRLADDLQPRKVHLQALVIVYLFLGAVVVAVVGGFRAFDRMLGLRL